MRNSTASPSKLLSFFSKLFSIKKSKQHSPCVLAVQPQLKEGVAWKHLAVQAWGFHDVWETTVLYGASYGTHGVEDLGRMLRKMVMNAMCIMLKCLVAKVFYEETSEEHGLSWSPVIWLPQNVSSRATFWPIAPCQWVAYRIDHEKTTQEENFNDCWNGRGQFQFPEFTSIPWFIPHARGWRELDLYP